MLNFPVRANVDQTDLIVGDTQISIYADLSKYEIGSKAMTSWITASANIVSNYYGMFPVPQIGIALDSYSGSGIRSGHAHGQPVLQIVIEVGEYVNQDQLDNDWILVHEMIHMALADIPDVHHWLEEGLPTYIESISRVQYGDLAADYVWKGFMRGMPKGLPMAGDEGLDNTRSWGRIYWGGAIFCLILDVEIRIQTGNAMGLQDGLKAVLENGLTLDKSTTMTNIIEIVDESTNTTAMSELYLKLKDTPEQIDLSALWLQLGVQYHSKTGRVHFDYSAPLSEIRQAITQSKS